jgi:hypothetical protein
MKMYILKSCLKKEIIEAQTDKKTIPKYTYYWGFFQSYYEAETQLIHNINIIRDWYCIKKLFKIDSEIELSINLSQQDLQELFNSEN